MAKQSQKTAQKRREAKRHRRSLKRARAAGATPALGHLSAPLESLMPRLSQRILHIAQPFLDDDEWGQAREFIIDLAVFAWNAALIPGGIDLVDEVAAESFGAGSPAELAALRAMVAYLVDRRNALFPHDKRLVTTHDIVDTGGELRLIVAASYVDDVPAPAPPPVRKQPARRAREPDQRQLCLPFPPSEPS